MNNLKFLLFILPFVVSACSSKEVFNETIKFDNTVWSKDSIVRFSIEVTDTASSYNMVLSITNTDDYQYSNLYLFTDVFFANKTPLRDTIEFILAAPDGQWLGTGMQGYTNNFQYKKNFRFPEAGTYVFAFEQAMRCSKSCSVEGIKSITLSLNKK